MNTFDLLKSKSAELRRIAERHGGRNLRVFGSAAQPEQHKPRDVDLLVDVLPGTTLLNLGAIQYESEQLLGIPVDLLTPLDLPESFRQTVLEQSRPL